MHSSRVIQTIDQLVIFCVRWPLHVCNGPFAQHAVENGAPCVSLCPQQGLTLVGLLALAFAFGGFFVLGTVLRVLVLALALAVLLAFAFEFVFWTVSPFLSPGRRRQAVFLTSQCQWLQRLK